MLKLPSTISLRLSAKIGEKDDEGAGIWAPSSLSFTLRWRPVFGPQCGLKLLLAPGEHKTGNALQLSTRFPLSPSLLLRIWMASGRPEKGAPVYILPPQNSSRDLPGRGCFQPFYALAAVITFRIGSNWRVESSGYLFQDYRGPSIKYALQSTLKL